MLYANRCDVVLITTTPVLLYKQEEPFQGFESRALYDIGSGGVFAALGRVLSKRKSLLQRFTHGVCKRKPRDSLW